MRLLGQESHWTKFPDVGNPECRRRYWNRKWTSRHENRVADNAYHFRSQDNTKYLMQLALKNTWPNTDKCVIYKEKTNCIISTRLNYGHDAIIKIYGIHRHNKTRYKFPGYLQNDGSPCAYYCKTKRFLDGLWNGRNIFFLKHTNFY